MKPSISVVIPVYNVEPYIEACIRSVMRQTYQGDMECIIVDDCGTDRSMEIAEKLIVGYHGPVSFQILRHDYNRGLSAARNTGLDVASKDYVFFIDSDDELTADCLERLSEPLNNGIYDIIIGKFETQDGIGTFDSQVHGVLRMPHSDQLKNHEILYSYCNGDWVSMAWNKLYLLSFLRLHKLRFLEGLFHEDELWSLQVACLAKSLYAVHQTTYKYRRRKNSLTDTFNKDSYSNANAYCLQVMEMGRFVKEYGIQDLIVWEIIRSRFYEALVLIVSSPLLFIRRYRMMRNALEPIPKVFLKDMTTHKKRLIRDAHLMLPLFLAPIIEYGFSLSIFSVKKINKVL